MATSFWSREGRGLVVSLLFGACGVAGAIAWSRAGRGASAEVAAIAAAQKQRDAGDRAGALGTLRACAARDLRSCRCADAAEELAVDHADAWSVVEKAICDSAEHGGARAEALVATGRAADGLREAAAALARDPKEAHATFARAWALSTSGDSSAAMQAAERAVGAGRGVPALLLLGSLRFGAGDAEGARPLFDEATRLAPDDARAAFDVALVAQKQGRYRDAREGYLRALSIDPKMVDARYNLALLAHGVGADDEARHDLNALVDIAPDDPRIPGLRAMLARR
jgi:tetratricopeptide (TPR) repeat protein